MFFIGPAEEKKQVNRKVKQAISLAKMQYKNKIEQIFQHGNDRAAWQLKTWPLSIQRLREDG